VLRQIENAIQAEVLRYLYDEDAKPGHDGFHGHLVAEITVQDLLARMGIPVEKRTHVLLRQATAAMRQAGWTRFKSSRGDRPWMFRRPAPGFDHGPGGSESSPPPAPDACPF
jgi:hypothetical protein